MSRTPRARVPLVSPANLVSAGCFSVALALAACAGSAAAAEPPNLLSNPSAEEGTLLVPTHWDTTHVGLPTARFAWDAETAHEGKRSLYVVNTSDVVPYWYNWSQTLIRVNHLGGKDLVLHAWAKTRFLAGKAYLLLQAYRDTVLVESIENGIERPQMRQKMRIKPANDPQIEMGWARKYFSGEHPEWTPVEVRLYVPPSTNVILVRAGVFGVGEAWFDDFTLTAEPARPEFPFALGKNLLADPGFEGNLDAWDYSLPPMEGIHIRVDGAAHSGLQSCLLDSQKRPHFQLWTHAFQVFNTRQLSGKRVRISGWLKTENLKSNAFLNLAANGMYGAKRWMVRNQKFGTNDWTFISDEVDIPKDTYNVWARAAIDTSPGKAWFDDLKFEVLGDSAEPPAQAVGKGPPSRKNP